MISWIYLLPGITFADASDIPACFFGITFADAFLN
jgi:hypothetical protein